MMEWLAASAAKVFGETFIKTVGGIFLDGYKAKLGAANDHEKLAADIAQRELAVEQREAELAQATVVVEQGRWWTAVPRPLMVAPVGIYLWKVIVWDIVLGWGVTDPIKDPLVTGIVTVMVGAYFGGRSVEKVAGVVAGIFRK